MTLRSARRGVTLMELILAILLAATLGVPTGLLLGEHLHLNVRTRDSMVAAQLARAELERLDARNDFFPLSSGTPSYPGFPYQLTVTVECVVGNCTGLSFASQGVKRIRIAVTRAGSSLPLAQIVTYRTKHVQFGS